MTSGARGSRRHLAIFNIGSRDGFRASDTEILRGLGIPPDDPRRAQKLGELERRDVGRDVAARTGQTFVPSVPIEFTGRVDGGSPHVPDGYAVVSDGRRFVVLTATSTLRALRGKEVTVTRDDRGRVLVGPALDRDIGR